LPCSKRGFPRNGAAPIGLSSGFFAAFDNGNATYGRLRGYIGNLATQGVLEPMGDSSLSGWMRALIEYVRSGEPDLTNRQMALLMLVYLTPGPHTVRGLARQGPAGPAEGR
jgi:hypothetical protein